MLIQTRKSVYFAVDPCIDAGIGNFIILCKCKPTVENANHFA